MISRILKADADDGMLISATLRVISFHWLQPVYFTEKVFRKRAPVARLAKHVRKGVKTPPIVSACGIAEYHNSIIELIISARHTPDPLPNHREVVAQIADKVTDKNTPRNLQGRDKYVVALEQYLASTKVYDPILDGLRSAVRYDKTYFDKIVASLLPLLEKLTTGKIAQLLAPNYSDLADPRPVIDWQQIIRQRGIVYVGLDALSDTEVAAAVGTACLPIWSQ